MTVTGRGLNRVAARAVVLLLGVRGGKNAVGFRYQPEAVGGTVGLVLICGAEAHARACTQGQTAERYHAAIGGETGRHSRYSMRCEEILFYWNRERWEAGGAGKREEKTRREVKLTGVVLERQPAEGLLDGVF